MTSVRPSVFLKILCSLVVYSVLAACLEASTRSVTFGDDTVSTGWIDLGLVDNANSPQTATYQDDLATPSGPVIFELTVDSSNKLDVANNTLRVSGGNQGRRIDSRSFADPTDDEWVRFRLKVSGTGSVDLTDLQLSGISLRDAAGDLVEYADSQSGVVQIQNPGNGAKRYGSGEALDGLQALSLSNVEALGDGTWSLQVTARAFGTDSSSSFRINNLSLDYTVAIPDAPSFPVNDLVLHLDAGRIAGVSDGAALTSGWSDLSASGAEATSPEPPVYLADGGGGYPAVRFDGVNDYLQVDVATGNQVSVFVVFANQRSASPPDYRDMLLTGVGGGNNLSLASSRSSPTAPNLPSFNALAGDGLSFRTWVNGHDTTDASGDLFYGRFYIGSAVYSEVPAETALRIGTRSTGGFNAGRNDIRELLVYDRALSDAERLQVQTYLAAKYQIPAVTRPLDHPVESYPHVLGSQQFGDQYSFGESGIYVVDYARQMLRQGNRVVKFRLSNRYDDLNNGDGFTRVASIDSLVELVRDQPEVKEVLDMPLTDYLFWMSTFSVPKWQDKIRETGQVPEADWTNFYGVDRPLFAADTYADPTKVPSPFQGLNPADAQKVYDEVYDLVVYLLQTYSGTGKSFYLGNWEGDWMLAQEGTIEPDTVATPARLQAMIDWANIRQQAVDDAKAATAHSDVNVWFYVEANKMDWTREGLTCVVNSVIPAMPKLDFLSFSSYSIHRRGNNLTQDEAAMHADLDILQAAIDAKPDPSIPGSRLIIGEYGFRFGSAGRFDDFQEHAREHVTSLRNYLSWQGGTLRFILHWQFYSRQVTDEGVPFEMCQISEQQEMRPLYYVHENFFRAMREWVDAYYSTHAMLPSDRAYADQAVAVLGTVSDQEHVPDLSKPWPERLELSGSGSIQIPDTVTGSNQLVIESQLLSRFGRIMAMPATDWSVQSADQGVTVDSSGVVSVQGNASPGEYAISASLNQYPSVNAQRSIDASFPVASIYDTLTDLSKLHQPNPELTISSANAATRFEGDTFRARRISSTSPQAMVWKVPDLNRFYAKVYYVGSLGSFLSADVSADGLSWQTVELRVDPPTVTADGWGRSWIAPLNSLPAGMNYFRLVLQHPTDVWAPQVGEVVLYGAETGFDFWQQQAFVEAGQLDDPEISGPSADPTTSGVTNLYRYFADISSDADGSARLPELVDGGAGLRYRVPFDPNKLDVLTRVKGSIDLQTWDTTLFDSSSDAALVEDGWLYFDVSNLPESAEWFFKLELSL